MPRLPHGPLSGLGRPLRCRRPQARAGEFTQRAFLNGRLDLAQAEGVADLLDAQSRRGPGQAAGQLSGALSRRIVSIYSALVV